eukprot:scaffold14525_cov46-Phaeocystis_antarctica.AAC.2
MRVVVRIICDKCFELKKENAAYPPALLVSPFSRTTRPSDDGGRNTLVPVPGASGVGGHQGARPPGVHGPRRLHGRPKGGAPASLVPSPPGTRARRAHTHTLACHLQKGVG